MMTYLPPVGSSKADLDSPALCIDLDKFESNIRLMVEKCRKAGVDWRPHSKCHKSPAIAKKLIDAGAIGVTCAKLGEAEVMAAGGIKDLLIANMVVGRRKMERLAEVCRIADPIVCVDHEDHVAELGAAMAKAGVKPRVLIEVDLGLNRVGVQPGEAAVNLARSIVKTPSLQFAGIMGYEGHLLLVADPVEKETKVRESIASLVATKDLLHKNDLYCPIVSCGGTGSYMATLGCPGITELQAGGAIFMDQFYREKCNVAEFDYALTILATIVSRPAPDRAIIDAGRKTMNMELTMPQVLDRKDIEVVSLSAEHGTLRLGPTAQNLRIGDRLEFVLGYSDLTTVLHNQFYAFRGDKLETIWPLEGRGRLD